jgi:hypothetical protein
MRLIERNFVRQLNAEARLIFEATRVVCSLDIPVAALIPTT